MEVSIPTRNKKLIVCTYVNTIAYAPLSSTPKKKARDTCITKEIIKEEAFVPIAMRKL